MITPEHLKKLDYDTFVATLIKDPHEIKKTIDIDKCALIHDAFGLVGEAGEFCDVIKKHVIYNQPLDLEHAKEELGDILFFFTDALLNLNLTIDEVMAANREKLTKRYAQGYSDAAAKARADKQ